MATKFVAAVALLALCHANPVLINGILYRDGRAYSMGQASSYGGVSTAQADAHGGEQLARDGSYYPEHAIAQAQTYNAPSFSGSAYGTAKAVAQTHNGAYYPIPAPASVITYEQHFAPAVSSESHAASNRNGVAHSSASTKGVVGGYGGTSSNAHTEGSGSADSHANYGSTSSSAKTYGYGSAESSAQNNGVDVRTPIYYTSYVGTPAQEHASSNAIVDSAGHASSSAKIGHGQGRTISWRFGTFYDAPASAQAQANTHGGYGAAKSAAHAHGSGSANANADVNGYGSAKSIADNHYGHGNAQSFANSDRGGSAIANAKVNSAGFGGARFIADVDGSRSFADAHTHGRAASSARTQGVNTVIRVANSQANSSGHGYANANALAV